MSLRVSPRPHPSTISFDYSVSTLTRTFRIGKEKQNYFCALVDARTRVVRVVFEDRVPPRDELDEIERPPPPSYPSQYALENYKFIKKQAYSLRSRDSFFLFSFFPFVPAYTSERTLCRALDHHSSTTKTFRPSDRCFPFFYSSICMKIIVQTMSRWKKRRGKRSRLRTAYTHARVVIE